mgnify:CR=1 FL=1
MDAMQLIRGLCALTVFVLGTVVGSFLNVCIYRIPLHITVVKGRSFCPRCKKTLKWYDMFPVVSWLVLRGRCRFCGQPISPRYPVIEAANGLLWLLAWQSFGWQWAAAAACLSLSALLCAAMIDHDTGEIPDGISIFLLVLAGLAMLAPGYPVGRLARLAGLAAVSLPMLVLAVWKGGFGGGDVKLCAAFGLLWGWQRSLLAALIAAVAGAAWGVVLLRRGAGGKTAFAFGPFLALGMAVAVLWGGGIIGWYLGLLGL